MKIIGVDPIGSQMALPKSLNLNRQAFQVEGIGYDFIPKNLDQQIVDKWYKCADKDTFRFAREIIKQEGILAGGSSGSVLWAALEYSHELPTGSRIVILCVDGIRNYMSKFINDMWMIDMGYFSLKDSDLYFSYLNKKVYGEESLIEKLKLSPCEFLSMDSSVRDCIKILRSNDILNLVIVDRYGIIKGVADMDFISEKILSHIIKVDDNVMRVAVKDFKLLRYDSALSRVTKHLFTMKYAVIENRDETYSICYPENLLPLIINPRISNVSNIKKLSSNSNDDCLSPLK